MAPPVDQSVVNVLLSLGDLSTGYPNLLRRYETSTMHIAITREVSPDFGHCELTHLARLAIDLDLAREQHRE